VFWEARSLGPTHIVSTCLECVTLLRQSDSFIPASGSQGFSVGYSRVIEINGSVEEGGWTEYEFFNEKEKIVSLNYPHSKISYPIRPGTIPTQSPSNNGLLKQKTFYRADSIPVLTTTNIYSEQFQKTIYGLEVRRVNTIGFSSLEYYSASSLLGDKADLITITYPTLSSSLLVPSVTREVRFDSIGNLTFTTATNYKYENPDHLQLTRSSVTTSKSRIHETWFKYAADYAAVDADDGIRLMAGSMHMHSIPIETTIKDITTPGAPTVLGRTIALYSDVNGKLLPKQVADLNVSSPIDSAALPRFVPRIGYDTTLYRLTRKFHYSADGNVQQTSSDTEIGTAYLWGYDGSLPVAEVRNARNNSFTSTTSLQSSEILALTLGGNSGFSRTYTFTSDYAGTVYVRLGVPAAPTYTTTATFSGLATGTVTLAINGCGLTVMPFQNVPAGTHTITITLTSSASGQVGACGEIEFPRIKSAVIQNGSVEFFYQGFEDDLSISEDRERSHTGLRYKPGDYTVTFQAPSSKKFRIEYWYSDTSGKWYRVSKEYQGSSMVLSEGIAIDDVRIYPMDALMRTFTYGPHGMTSVVNENGKTNTYDYDEFGRLAVIRDGDRNIEQAYGYEYRKD
jgi:YD repeat-containing protein